MTENDHTPDSPFEHVPDAPALPEEQASTEDLQAALGRANGAESEVDAFTAALNGTGPTDALAAEQAAGAASAEVTEITEISQQTVFNEDGSITEVTQVTETQITDTQFTETPAAEAQSAETPASDAAAAGLAGAAAGSAMTAGASTIQVSADHPMAQFYLDTPEPPAVRGNRLAGTLIALLASLAFALVYAGSIAAVLAPLYTPSQFVEELLASVTSLSFIVPVVVFFVALTVVVLIVNRAGWWAYVFGGFFVGLAVWVSAGLAWLFVEVGGTGTLEAGFEGWFEAALVPTSLLAGIIAREATVWFGAWIGARGRKVRARNAEALEEYETALASSRETSAPNATVS